MPRQNLCPNPAAKNNATGWGGSASPTRRTDLTSLPKATGVRSTGSGYISPPTGVVAPGDIVTISFYIKNSTGGAIASGKTVFIGYTRSAGGDVFPENFNTPAIGVNGNVQRVTFTTAAAPALATGIYLVIDSLPVDIDVTAVMYEPGATSTDYQDGDSTGWTWDGTDGNSASSEDDSAHVTTGTAQVSMRATAATSGGDMNQRGASYDIEDIMEALADVFNGVPTGDIIGGQTITMEAHAEVVAQIDSPAIVLELDDQTFDLNMGGGADSLTVIALALVAQQDQEAAQRLLWRFLSRKPSSGLLRLKTALEEDQTLGGLVSYAVLTGVRNIGVITYSGVDYLGAEMVIEVMS